MTESFVSQMMEFDADLFAAAMKLCNFNEADAADLLQDTYIRGYKAEHSFTPGTNMRAWLHTILRNAFINSYRRRAKFKEYVEAQVANGGIDSKMQSGPDPDHTEVLQAKEELAHLLSLIQDNILPQFYDVLVLVDLHEKSYLEAADLLDVPVGTIMSRLFRARKASQKLLLKHYEDLSSYVSRETLDALRDEVA